MGGLVAVVALAALVDGVLGIVEVKSSSSSSNEVLAPQEPGFVETYAASSFASSVARFGDLSRAEEEVLPGLLAWVAVERSWL